jgi:hypothetical protein
MAFRWPGSRVGMMPWLAAISGRAPLLSFPTMLRLQSQAVQIQATVADIWVAARLLFTERSPHRSYHDANRERSPSDQNCHIVCLLFSIALRP